MEAGWFAQATVRPAAVTFVKLVIWGWGAVAVVVVPEEVFVVEVVVPDEVLVVVDDVLMVVGVVVVEEDVVVVAVGGGVVAADLIVRVTGIRTPPLLSRAIDTMVV